MLVRIYCSGQGKPQKPKQILQYDQRLGNQEYLIFRLALTSRYVTQAC